MKILIYVLCNAETGLGHLHRMEALAGESVRRGHSVSVATDWRGAWPGVETIDAGFGGVGDFDLVLDWKRPDWVVIDLPGDGAARFVEPAQDAGARVCVVDGVGHGAGMADLVVSQGPEGEHCAPDYLLLRPGLFRHRWSGLGYRPLVWGGGADPMGLIPAFCQAFPDGDAFLLAPRFGDGARPPVGGSSCGKWTANASGEAVFGLMSTCGKLVCATGMICWEAASLGLPTYVFSRSKRHLKTALAMREMGYLSAWPMVGLPEDDVFRDFVEKPFCPTGKPLDGRGPERVVELLEKGI